MMHPALVLVAPLIPASYFNMGLSCLRERVLRTWYFIFYPDASPIFTQAKRPRGGVGVGIMASNWACPGGRRAH